jgi:hypothetical protein
MKIITEDMILDQWIEFSGGSRPGSSFIKFEEFDGEIIFHLKYVFDWDTKETTHFSKKISRDDFILLLEDLNQKSYAKIESRSKTENLVFEWRASEGRVQIRLELGNSSNLDGPGTYFLAEFRDLLLNVNFEN